MSNEAESIETPPGRLLDPFCFFVGEASAISGLGGEEAPSDSRYCFHTQYLTLQPGRAVYRCRFLNARASFGELHLRVHGFYPGFDAQLVASAKIYLEDIERDVLSLDVGFVALEGIQYALCGYVNDHTDMSVGAMDVHIEELGGHDRGAGQEQRVSLIGSMMKHEAVAKLRGSETPTVRAPMCQPFTQSQRAGAGYSSLWPQIAEASDDGRTRWAQVMMLQALEEAQMLSKGARTLVVAPPSPTLVDVLIAHGCPTQSLPDIDSMIEMPPPDEMEQAGSTQATEAEADIIASFDPTLEYEQVIDRVLERLAVGGMGLVTLSVAANMSIALWQNRLHQIALRLIGRGHQVVQFNFAADDAWWPEQGQNGLFLFMVRK